VVPATDAVLIRTGLRLPYWASLPAETIGRGDHAHYGAASLRFSSAGAVFACKTNHKQYNSGNSELKEKIPNEIRFASTSVSADVNGFDSC